MKKFLFLALCSVLPLFSQEIVFNNRPLAKVNGKTFSLFDVIKKMDVTLHGRSPEIFDNIPGLFQYYQQNWRTTLSELVEEQLILLDAEEKEFIKVSEGDVREEMQERYGPNIITTLSKFNLTYDEAQEMLNTEMRVQQMSWYRAYSKAIMSVTPDIIKSSYKVFLQQSPPKDEWRYQMLTIRGDDKIRCEAIAKAAYDLLQKDGATLNSVAEQISEEGVKVSASTEYSTDSKNLSEQHRSILSRLGVSEMSEPESQSSKAGGAVYRIFHLKGHDHEDPPVFENVSDRIKDRLVAMAVERERKVYVDKLKRDYQMTEKEFDESLPDGYQPFALL